MNSPFFSVVIPTFNRAERIRTTIPSVLNQSFRDFELLVVDDGSTDGTRSVVEEFTDPRIQYLGMENRERGAARNEGVNASRGRYVTFLDSDDLWYPAHLEQVHRTLQARESPPVFHQAYEVVDEEGKVLWRPAIFAAVLNRLLFTRGNVMSCQGVFLRNDVAAANPFEESRDLAGLEDWELWIRLSTQYEILHDPVITSALVQHRQRSVSSSRADQLVRRVHAFNALIAGNPAIQRSFSDLLPALWANTMTYLGLHLSEIPGHKAQALRYWLKGVSRRPSVLFQKRTMATFRNILLP